MRKVLNVGGGSKANSLPQHYAGFEHVLLDIDPKGKPDLVCDARQLKTLQPEQFDAIYCSHNLEHFHHHEVQQVLTGFLHVLKPGGIAELRVPDIGEVMRYCVEKRLDIEDVIYISDSGPIMVMDVLYGYGVEIKRSGHDYFAHKTGFTPRSLAKALTIAGFATLRGLANKETMEVYMLASKGTADQTLYSLVSKSIANTQVGNGD